MVNLGKLKLKNPVMTASGTFGYGAEFKDLLDLDKLGAIITKTITVKPRQGNAMPRILELPYGIINRIGLQNVGLEIFISEKLPQLKKITKTPVIVSIAGVSKKEFLKIAEELEDENIDGLELNISCPNVKGRIISQYPEDTFELVEAVRKKTKNMMIIKLCPDVTDVSKIAKAAEDAGADAVSLINTVPALFYDGGKAFSGGLSGPCIKHIALRKVYETANSVKIPVIGIGGIMDAADAMDFLKAGATAIQVGTGNFIDPEIPIKIVEAITQITKSDYKD